MISDKCKGKWKIPYSKRTKVRRGSILRWIKLFRAGGEKIEALYPKRRNDIKKSRAIDENTANNLTWLTINSDIHSAAELIKEMKSRDLISSGYSLNETTVYRFLRSNDLMVYLKKRGVCNKKAVESNKSKKKWIQELLQGNICLRDLKQDLHGKMHCDDIKKLYDSIRNKPLRYRKRAVSILSICNGISPQTITEAVHIPSSTIRSNFKKYSEKGVNHIVSDNKKRFHTYEDPKYINKLFSILHAPPSTYGINRTTWRQKDIRQVMYDCNLPISSHALRKIIDNSGYKYRKARTTLTSNDPEYSEKVQAIKNILSNLNENEKFFQFMNMGLLLLKCRGESLWFLLVRERQYLNGKKIKGV